MAPRRFRRRFLLAALAFLAVLVGLGMVIGLLVGGGPGRRDGDRPGGPPPLVFVGGGVLLVGGVATALAYRRISRPVGELLGAAEQVASGDYDVDLVPEGPRDLRVLTSAFNSMAARLADADEQRRRFLADVTHELRTPLAVLQSGIEAQVDGIHPRDDRHLQSLLEETERLGRLVGDLHTLALADAGRIVLHRERVGPAALVEDAVAGHSAVAGQAGVALSTAIHQGLGGVELEVDPTRIRQVLDNLLSNAVRHTPPGGAVRVTVEPDGDPPRGVRVAVTDAGPGFAPDAVDRVFDRFTRFAQSDSTGSGLGLSIARDLVEAHGGTIAARNEPGGGATVSFTLPSTPPAA